MKRRLKAVLSIILCLSLIIGCAATSFASEPDEEKAPFYASWSTEEKQNLAAFINQLSNFFLNDVIFNLLSRLLPGTSMLLDYDSFNLDEFEQFYPGMEEFISSADADASWSLGYGQRSIIPDDFGKIGKYCRGGYAPWWYTTDVYEGDDIKVRTVVMNDGSGRGNVVFAVLDCIGFANADVRKVRAALSDYAKENNIVSINISATHTHTSIDAQGVWDNPVSTLVHNLLSSLTGGKIKPRNGIDEDYLNTIIERTSQAVKEAYENMTEGKLSVATIDCDGYIKDRTYPYADDDRIYRLFFEPSDGSKGTLIASFACHPEVVANDWIPNGDRNPGFSSKLSGDFVTYMEEVVNLAGYNFLYIQGNVGTYNQEWDNFQDGMEWTYHEEAERYGHEMGYIALAMAMTTEERIALNERTGDLLGVEEYSDNEGYSIWYDGLETVTEYELEPILNIRHSQFLVEIEQKLAVFLMKAGLASNTLIYNKADGKYYSVTEMGYLEIGDVSKTSASLKAMLSPGEIYNELVTGCDELEGFEYDCLRDTYGENIMVLDLMNDAAGYISPDNYYTINGYQYNTIEDKLEADGWCMMVSLGKNTASKMFSEFEKLVNGAKN